MKSLLLKKALFLAIILFFSSFFFPFFAILFGLIMNADIGIGAFISELIFRIANWPSMMLRIYPTVIDTAGQVVYDVGNALFSPLVIFVNAIGWTFLGLIIGLIITVIKKRKTNKG